MVLSDALGARLAVVLAAVCSVLVVRWLDDAAGERRAALRSRFVFGVPWATLLVAGFVLGVYLFVQGGFERWNAPLVLPFRAWSYLYPLGVLTAPFAHAGSGHLLGNLVGTLTFAPIAEYAWGHYRRDGDGAASSASASPASASTVASISASVFGRPLGRISVFFVGTLAVGVVTSLFALGPVIGFSGVVFALAGFSLVRYPLATVVALAAGEVLRLVYVALSTPVTTASAEPGFGAPWWAGIAIQGHAIGLLCGVLLGTWVIRRRGEGAPAARLWLGVLIFAVSQSLWAVYWYRGGESYVLFRGVGTALVFALATVVAVGVAAPDRPLSEALAASRLPGLVRERVPFLDRVFAPGSGLGLGSDPALDVDLGFVARRLATVVLVAALLGMSAPAAFANFAAVADGSNSAVSTSEPAAPDGPPDAAVLAAAAANGSGNPGDATGPNLTGPNPGGAIEIRGYTVRYAEGVENRLVSVVDVSAFGETTAVETSGVIVTNAEREIWTTAVSKSKLQFAGRERVRVGGLGWEAVVRVRRTGWTAAGGNTTYKIFTRPPDGDRRLAYAALPATATPMLDGKNVSIAPARTGYAIVVSAGNETLGHAPIPANNGSATVAGLTFDRRGDRLVAIYGDSEIPIAKRETYRGN